MDRILARMPKKFDYFLPAVAVVHQYLMHVQAQGRVFTATIEIADESHLFFSSLFPRMDIVMVNEHRPRETWECVLDLRETERAKRLATATKMHLTQAWGTLIGGNPQLIPNLGYLGARVRQEEVDVVIDQTVNDADKVLIYFCRNFPEAVTIVDRMNGLRPGTMFDKLCNTKMYIGERSGATYLAATMGKGLVELYPDDEPSWWLKKPTSDRYRMIYGREFSPELVFAMGETIWQTICNTMSQGKIITDKLASTVESVGVR